MRVKNEKSSRIDPEPSYGYIGIDEVGRGPLAGPVTVCAVYIDNPKNAHNHLFRDILGYKDSIIRDSKMLTRTNRNKIYLTIRRKRFIKYNITYSIKSVAAKKIDKIGINSAISECINRCIEDLRNKGVKIRECRIILDGGLSIKNKGIIYESVIRGDQKYLEVAIASIIAKEHRDAIMKGLSLLYPGYAWDKNAGYGTREHLRAIQSQGATNVHRISYLKGF